MPIVQFDWDEIEDNVDEEFDEDLNSTAEYTTEPNHFGNVICQIRDGVTSTLHTDGQGSTLALTNDAGFVTDTYAYNAFGEMTEGTGTTVFPYRFVGQKGYYFDSVTGDNYVRRRHYGADVARWMSLDPLGFVDGVCLYAAYFVPNGIDPSGTKIGRIRLFPLGKVPEKVDCGNSWGLEWHLALPVDSPCDGYFVQKVERRCLMNDCDECGTLADVALPKLSCVFYEAFGIHDRGTPKHNSAAFDLFSALVPDSKCYTELALGEVRFYCNKGKVAEEILKWPKGQGYCFDKCASPSFVGDIRSTKDQPKFWDDDLVTYAKNFPDEAHAGFHTLLTFSVCCPCTTFFGGDTWETSRT